VNESKEERETERCMAVYLSGALHGNLVMFFLSF